MALALTKSLEVLFENIYKILGLALDFKLLLGENQIISVMISQH